MASEIGNTELESISEAKEGERENQFFFFSFTLGQRFCPKWRRVETKISTLASEWVFQLEEGKENGFLHWQGWMHLKKRSRCAELKRKLGWTEIHLEPCKNIQAAHDYCLKEDTRKKGPFMFPRTIEVLAEDQLYPWQQNIVDIIDGPADPRKILWYADTAGNGGKTVFAKFLCQEYGAVFVNGKGNDIKNYIAKTPYAEVIIFGFARTTENTVSYEALESLKDGLFFSGKYDTEMVIRNPPHILVFANFIPNLSKLTNDRWSITNLS